MEKDELKYLRHADAPAAHQVYGAQVHLLEVQAVGDHQLHAGSRAGVDHLLAFLHGDRHGLLAQDVDARARRADGVLGVLGVGQRDVHGVHVLEARVVVLVPVGVLEVVAGAPGRGAWCDRR